MGLTKLPPLPRKRTTAQERALNREKNLRRPLSPLGSWGGLEVGRWAEGEGGSGIAVVGRCHKCGEIYRAIDLEHEDGNFGQDGGWTCFGCRKRSNITRK